MKRHASALDAYDAQDTVVARLAPWQQAGFAACCAHRLVPVYRKFCEKAGGAEGAVIEAMKEVWSAISSGRQLEAKKAGSLLMTLEELVPDTELHASPLAFGAQECIFALCSSVEYLLHGEHQCVYFAGEHAINVADHFAQEDAVASGDVEAWVLSHPLMQQELRRQARDVSILIQLHGPSAIETSGFPERRESILDSA